MVASGYHDFAAGFSLLGVMSKMLSGRTLAHDISNYSIVVATHLREYIIAHGGLVFVSHAICFIFYWCCCMEPKYVLMEAMYFMSYYCIGHD